MSRRALPSLLLMLVPAVAWGQEDVQPSTPQWDFSGVIFANYQTGGTLSNRAQNRFDVERVYLTFRSTAGERASIRVTTDVFQQRDTTRDDYYRGWAMRMKYAWLQYDYLRRRPSGLEAVARIGLLHTPIAEYEESFFLRYVSSAAFDAGGYFSTADAGISTLVTLPNLIGEAYLAVLNGNGYTSRELDRFKDIGGRLSVTPLAKGTTLLKTLTVTPWFYKGAKASDFAGRRGTVGPVGSARQKDRYGLFLGLLDPRLQAGLEVARRVEDFESADTTLATSPTVVTRTGRLFSAFTVVKPLAFVQGKPTSPVGLLLRTDRIQPDVDAPAYTRAYIAGLQFELTRRTFVSLDLQHTMPRAGSTATDTRVWFVHILANFP